LSGLVYSDPERAERFIDEFSRLYRYVLETIEKPLVTLEEELSFARSYIYLQQIRYGEGLMFNVRVDAHCLNRFLPSLALQVVLENAIRHNVISTHMPLVIDLTTFSDTIVIRNNLNLKLSGKASTGIGQKNLTDRYALTGSAPPSFIQENATYVATLPLLTAEL
jgi:LytS/YehU family sensor histidine kinase